MKSRHVEFNGEFLAGLALQCNYILKDLSESPSTKYRLGFVATNMKSGVVGVGKAARKTGD